MQTGYQGNFAGRMLGQIQGDVVEAITLLPEADVTVSSAVIRGTDKEAQALTATASSDPVGIAALSHRLIDGVYKADNSDEITVLTKGSIAVEVPAGVTVTGGEDCYFIISGAELGKYTKTQAGTTTNKVGVFQTTKDSQNLAIVKIDIVG